MCSLRSHALAALLVFATLIAPASARCAPAEITRVWTEFRTDQERARLSDRLRGRPPRPRPHELRSQPAEAGGFYFALRLYRSQPLRTQDLSVRLSVVAPDAAEPRIYTFAVPPSPTRKLRLELGITGADWPHGSTQPLAWCIEVIDAQGALIAREESYLWSFPTR